MTVRPSLGVLLVLLASWTGSAFAQAPPADAAKVSVSGYIQPQWEVRTTDDGSRDRSRLRRAVVTLDVALGRNWQAELQTDLGPLTSDGDRVVVKNALIAYAGWEAQYGVVLTVGNQKIPFSRSVLASSSRRGLVERPFTGDRAYGSPGRALSIRADGWHRGKTIFWSAAVADTRHGTDLDELRLDGVAELGDDGLEGHLLAGRVEFHPFGEVTRTHGDFDRGPLRVTVGGGVYGWQSDADSPLTAQAADVNRVSGLEVSGALRGAGLSVDAEFEHVSASARRPFPSDGLYANGSTHLRKASVEAGYMILPGRFELLAAVDALHTPTFDRPWRRIAAGANWYVKQHDVKFSFMHRESLNDEGVREGRSRAAYVQAQFAF